MKIKELSTKEKNRQRRTQIFQSRNYKGGGGRKVQGKIGYDLEGGTSSALRNL